MFHRASSAIILYVVALCALLAAATIIPATETVTVTITATAPGATAEPASQCNAGNLQCCTAVERADSSLVGQILGLLGVVLETVEGLVGITCVPIDILGIGQSATCLNQPVCCENNDFSGLIAIGCVPIIINL